MPKARGQTGKKKIDADLVCVHEMAEVPTPSFTVPEEKPCISGIHVVFLGFAYDAVGIDVAPDVLKSELSHLIFKTFKRPIIDLDLSTHEQRQLSVTVLERCHEIVSNPEVAREQKGLGHVSIVNPVFG